MLSPLRRTPTFGLRANIIVRCSPLSPSTGEVKCEAAGAQYFIGMQLRNGGGEEGKCPRQGRKKSKRARISLKRLLSGTDVRVLRTIRSDKQI